MKVVWALEARADRRAIYRYIEKDNPRAALALDSQFAKRVEQLIAYPLIGRLGRVAQTRELVVHPNYILIYDLKDDLIRILRILHAARQWPTEEM